MDRAPDARPPTAELAGTFALDPVEEGTLRRRPVLECSNALVPQMHSDGPFAHDLLKTDPRVEEPICSLPWDRIEDIRGKGLGHKRISTGERR